MAPSPKHIEEYEYKSFDVAKDEPGDVPSTASPKHLVLIGGGHAHVQVIKAFSARPRERLQVTLIDQQYAASYSGMVPGCIAKLYTPDQTLLHLTPLAQWADLKFLHRTVVDVDLDQKLIYTAADSTKPSTTTTTKDDGNRHEESAVAEQEEPIPFDAISIDIGSTTRDLQHVPGAYEYTIPTRPIADLIRRIEEAEQKVLSELQMAQQQNRNTATASSSLPQRTIRVVVVGAGVAGLELAMSIQGRWNHAFDPWKVHVTVVDAVCHHEEILPSESPACRHKLGQLLEHKGIELRFECGVKEIRSDRLVFQTNTNALQFDYCIWATGAGAHNLAYRLQKRGLALDDHGWIQVNKCLQSTSHSFVFAAGDCASHPASPPKAGVFAVRSGPILIQNLTRYLLSRGPPVAIMDGQDSSTTSSLDLVEFVPQDDFLKLLACGDGKALGFRFGIPIHGKWVWEMKDTIDNTFMDLFKVEKLPTDPEDKKRLFDISQYDASYACQEHNNTIDPQLAAQTLRRDDDDVNYKDAWKIIRDMACMAWYRDQVLQQWHATEEMVLQGTATAP
uniref:FAD/NAD(P)-binding domain-containing protein n=1 Tax=Amphora coffeiformis TaxID=265554 RepID=A0A7S3PD46_9STRA|eukprot:scaffold34609_cov146-Amphora_coffeaeformis.AAC.10